MVGGQLDGLLEVVHRADDAVMEIYDTDSVEVETKADNTPLTQADIAAHRILSSGIAELFPDVPILSEEGDEDENREIVASDKFWLIDPIDGTREFIQRSGHFTVCVALVEGDLPSFGVVSAPAFRETYYGGPGGSFKWSMANGGATRRIHTRPDAADKVVLQSLSGLDAVTDAFIKRHYPDHERRSVGSQLKMTQIADGRADVYPRLDSPTHLWDVAAGHAILLGAGGSLSQLDGSPIDYHAKHLRSGDFIARSSA
jgi:3'(2'), 5'-bisphosphate nucleotidase